MPLQTETAPSTPALTLTQSRVIRASRERVYQAWTNPQLLAKWFGPAGLHCSHAEMDVRVGGAYRIDMVPNDPPPANSDGTECAERRSSATGTYTKVLPNELLQFNWHPQWTPEEESLVTIMLKDVDGGTEITIRHENFATEVSRDGHNKGWAGCLDKLQAMFAV
jgi:uncharacterized protein YndB with AHSA1/START domain